MKTSKYLNLIIVIAIAGITFLIWKCETKKVGPTEPETNSLRELYLTGRVVDKETRNGIVNVDVQIGTDTKTTTDNQGYYKVKAMNVGSGTVNVLAHADGYGYGSTQAFIDLKNGGATVNIIPLLQLNSMVSVDITGGTISTINAEGFSSNSITLNIPNGALDKTTSISVSSFEGIEVPGLPPQGYLNVITSHIEPDALVLNKKANLILPLPFVSETTDSLRLLYYIKETNKWQLENDYAVIDSSSNTASVQISHFGTYSLGINGRYEETLDNSQILGTYYLDTKNVFKTIGWMAGIEYPNGIPTGVSIRWLKNTVSQNTLIGSGRLSFFDTTFTIINYISIAPDSAQILSKNNSVNCPSGYIKVPIYRIIKKRVPESVFLMGRWTTIYNEITEQGEQIGWYCKHDQGGG